MNQNPYAPPGANIQLHPERTGVDGFIEGGRSVGAGQGAQWFTGGWELFKKSPGMWIVLGIVYMLVVVGSSMIPVAGQFVVAGIAPFLTAGLMLGCRDLGEGRKLGFGHLLAGFEHAGGLVVLAGFSLGWVAVLGGVGLALGAGGAFMPPPRAVAGANPFAVLSAILPFMGISIVLGIPVSMATYYAPSLVALNGLSPLAALKNSFLASIKNIVPFIVYGLLAMVLAFPAALTCGIGLLVYLPVIFTSMYMGYRDVFYAEPLPR
jgi:hypothetical protein